jgi:glycine/D-amino acid oxidase-like deaminating enzyme/nitrite reductase/ring-hydroxylating ferredoxin subunit
MQNSGRSFWIETANVQHFPQLTGNVEVDVAIIGGGLVGVTTARFLKDAGLKVAVLEARRVGQQVTGKSTAKLTSQHRLSYQALVKSFGKDRARLYADAQETALACMLQFDQQYRLEADIQRAPAFVYTRDQAFTAQLEKEVEIARELGLPASLVTNTELPFDVLLAMRWDNQAKIHPVKYVAGLAATLPGDGSSVFENSRVTEWEPTKVTTQQGSVKARHVVMATHLPLGQVGLYYTMAHPKAEPVIVAQIGRELDGMYISAEQPTRSVRTYRKDGEVFAVAAGSHFKPGHTEEEEEQIKGLETWLAQTFDAAPAQYRWINEDYTSIDGAPFVGWSSSRDTERYLVATGFGGWGISNSTAAAMIIRDLVLGRESPWLALFDATRIKPVAGAKEFVKENVKVAADLVGGYLSRKLRSFDELQPGQAAILKLDEYIAAFRDDSGALHAISAVCTHMGCNVGWNALDRTWDCPCHGSRFALSGEVIHGPAVTPLERKSVANTSEPPIKAP